MITDSMTARLKPVQPGRVSLVSVLDIGSTKICCVIARLSPRPEGKSLKGRTHSAEIIGFGYGASSGIKSGVITDLAKAEQAIRTVVGMAERAAGLTLQSVIVNVTARPTSDVGAIRKHLVEQVTGMVRWTESIQWASGEGGVGELYELGAGKVLTGLAKRIAPDAQATAVNTPADIDALVASLSA